MAASGLLWKLRIVSAAELRQLYGAHEGRRSMRTTLAAFAFAACIGLSQSASALPARTTVDSASTAHLQQLAMMGASGARCTASKSRRAWHSQAS